MRSYKSHSCPFHELASFVAERALLESYYKMKSHGEIIFHSAPQASGGRKASDDRLFIFHQNPAQTRTAPEEIATSSPVPFEKFLRAPA